MLTSVKFLASSGDVCHWLSDNHPTLAIEKVGMDPSCSLLNLGLSDNGFLYLWLVSPEP